jgi:transcriptional regulator with XRE-family HTH domain
MDTAENERQEMPVDSGERDPATVESVRAKLRKAVAHSGLSYEQIGIRMGISRRAARSEISRLLSLKAKHDPRLSTLVKMAAALEVDLHSLV